MSEAYYVTCDAEGVEHTGLGPIAWTLPSESAATPETTAPADKVLVLRRPVALIDDLEPAIYVAEPIETSPDQGDHLEVRRARIVAGTVWDEAVAARFALTCAEHVLGDAASATLPNGRSLAEVIADARATLEAASPEAEERLGLLARIRAARRLQRDGRTVQEIALELLEEDNAASTSAIDDPAWATAATVVDAVLAAIEALRAFALPRYVAAREDPVDGTGTSAPSIDPHIISTPWGPIALGGEHHATYVPAAAAARDAAARARDVAREHGGASGEAAERAWQGALLAELLSS